MKKTLSSYIVSVLLLFMPVFGLSQPTFDMNFVVTQNDYTVGGNLVVMMQIRANPESSPATFKLGSSNLRFNFNPQKVQFVSMVAQNFTTPPFYHPMTSTGTNNLWGFASFNVMLAFANFGTPVIGSDWVDVAEMTFEIISLGDMFNFDFRPFDHQAGNCVAYMDDQATLLNGGEDHDHIIWDGTGWFGGNGVDEAPNDQDDVKDAVISGSGAAISGSVDIDQLTVDPAGELTLATDAQLTIYGDMATNDNLTMLSSASGTASLITWGTVSGISTAERYIPPIPFALEDDGWHLLSSPVGAGQSIQPEFVPVPLDDNYDFYKFDEVSYTWINHRFGSSGSYTWNPDFESQFVTKRGYLVAYESAQNNSFTGQFTTGDQTFDSELSYTPALDELSGWNLLGNPFPSGFDWTEAIHNADVGSAVYVFDAALGQYKAHSVSHGTFEFDGVVPGMNGFFIQVFGANPTLTIPNSARVHESGFYKETEIVLNTLSLYVEGNGKYDNTIVYFNDQSTNGFDVHGDAVKIFGVASAPQLYTKADDINMSINSMPYDAEGMIIPLCLAVGADDIYTISLEENTIPQEATVWLEDNLTGLSYDLNLQPSVSFRHDPGMNRNRFYLLINTITGIEDIERSSIDVYSYNKDVFVKVDSEKEIFVSIEDLLGRNVYRDRLNGQKLYRIPIANEGFYIVSVEKGPYHHKGSKVFIVK